MKTIDRERAHCSSSHSDTVGTRNRPLREVLSTWLHSRHTDTMRSTRSLYHGHRYPLEILSHAVWLYYKFGLSLRNVEDLLAKRGLVVTYETIRRWCTKFGSEYVRRLKRRQSRFGDSGLSGDSKTSFQSTSFACTVLALGSPSHRVHHARMDACTFRLLGQRIDRTIRTGEHFRFWCR